MALDSILKLGRIEKEYEVFKDFKVKLHTLTAQEQQEALSSVPDKIQDDVTRFSFLQQALVVQATDKINGETHSKEELRKFYGELQNSLLQSVFNHYLELINEQNTTFDELKKK